MALVPSNYWVSLKICSIFENLGKIYRGGQNCPFDDLNLGEVLLSNYANGSGSSMVPEQAKDLTSAGSCKLILNGEGRGELTLIMSTTKETACQLNGNACVQVDIQLTDVEVEEFVKSFFSSDKNGLCLESVEEFKIKQLVFNGSGNNFQRDTPQGPFSFGPPVVQGSFGSPVVQDSFGSPFGLQGSVGHHTCQQFPTNFHSPSFGNFQPPGTVGTLTFQKVLVVLKVAQAGTLSDDKISKIWTKNQQISGEKLLTEGLASDFTIEAANGKKFPCHKFHLVGKSAVFAGILNSNKTEANSHTLKMEDMSPDAVEGFLSYLYTGSLKKVKSNLSVIFEMLQAAHKYQIKDLEIVCHKVIQSADSQLFHAATAFELYEFCGNVTELQSLQKKAVKVLKDNGKKYGDNGELQTLISSIGSSGQKQMAFAKWMSKGVQR